MSTEADDKPELPQQIDIRPFGPESRTATTAPSQPQFARPPANPPGSPGIPSEVSLVEDPPKADASSGTRDVDMQEPSGEDSAQPEATKNKVEVKFSILGESSQEDKATDRQMSQEASRDSCASRSGEDRTVFDSHEDKPSSAAGLRASARAARVSLYPGRNEEEHLQKHKRKSMKQQMVASQWYHGETAHKLRSFVHGKTFVILMAVALLIALFMPEIWVLCGVDSNTEVDIILTIVLILFVFEFVALSALDATYFLSFFFLMDIVGTVSMIFDISYMVGNDNTQVQTFSSGDSDAQSYLMLLRAARAARVGARAGRLSKIVRMLRFLPFLSNTKDDESGGVAASISKQLGNLLATRVACLTIILVMVIPVFEILSFPQADHSLQTWVERLAADVAEGTDLGNEIFTAEVASMNKFFGKRSYGPYLACWGKALSENEFKCDRFVDFDFRMGGPRRGGSALWVYSNDFMVGFNMHQTQMLEKGLSIVNIFFIVNIMVFSGLALSSVVTTLAVRPLERMLKQVREIAQQVFNMSSEMLEQQDDEGEEFDINTSAEMVLLEKVVAKLAIIADLQAGTGGPEIDEDMAEEDVGILNMMQGTDVVQAHKRQRSRRVSRLHKVSGQSARKEFLELEKAGVSREIYDSFYFNTLVLNKQQLTTVGFLAVAHFHGDGDGFVTTSAQEQTLVNFVAAIEKEYPANPFHNFSHAADVVHGTARMLRLVHSENFLTELEQYSLLIAALGHDVGHPGVNNGFLSEVGHELAIQYNDLSPLENMHVSKLYSIVTNLETNVFASLSKDQYKEVRKLNIETILHTDMMGHQAMVKDLTMLFSINSDIFTTSSPENEMAQTEIFCQPEAKMLVMNNILHSADVSNPCRQWEVTQAWAHRCLEEFFSQGDQEKMLGVPVQFLNDRDKLNRPNSQIGFLEFMIAPFFAAQIRLFHRLHEYGDHMAHNIGKWEELWAEEVKPDEESRAKVQSRVDKVKANMLEAKEWGVQQSNKDISYNF